MLDPSPAQPVRTVRDRTAVKQPDDHLRQIQEILFGRERREIDQRLSDLDEVFGAQVKDLRSSTRNHVSTLENELTTRMNAIEQRVDADIQDRAIEHSKLSAEVCATLDKFEERLETRLQRMTQQLRAEVSAIREQVDVRTTEISLQFEAARERLDGAKLERNEIAQVFRQMAETLGDPPSVSGS